MLEILRADSRHKREINRLIRDTKIGSRIYGPVPKNTWIARIGGKIVGYAGLNFIGRKTAILEGVAVEEDLRHQGIGSALMNHRINFAHRRGVKVFALTTMHYRFRFYKHHGFATCPRKYLPEFLREYPQFTEKSLMKCAVMVKGIKIKRS